MSDKIVIGSRGSDLALWQANFVRDELKKISVDSEIKIITTKGDKIQNISLEKIEGKGFFTKEIEDALLSGEIDIAVHSHKDLPTEPAPGLIIAGLSEREDPSELLLIRKDAVDTSKEFDLKENAVVGTSSSRRTAQLHFFRSDIICEDIRGNVPTRVEKLRRGDFDAVLLAYAGIHRLQLDLSDVHAVKIPPHKLIPAPAQGVLAYQCREGGERIKEIIAGIHAAASADTVFIERTVMNLFHGGCHMPLGVHCVKRGDTFCVWAAQADDKNGNVKRIYLEGKEKEKLSVEIFQTLQEFRPKSVFITSDISPEDNFSSAIMAKGFALSGQSLIRFEKTEVVLPDCDWIFFTSKNGVQFFLGGSQKISSDIKIAAYGNETAKAIRDAGYTVDFTGTGDAESTATEFIKGVREKRIVFLQAVHAENTLREAIGKFNTVTKLGAYNNEPVNNAVLPYYDILVFTSPMNARAFLSANTITGDQKIIAIGTTTKEYLVSQGVTEVSTPPFPELMSIADIIY